MREIIGENLKTFLDNMSVAATKSYSGNIGYWPNFEVWEMSEEDYEKICETTEKEYELLAADDSWWRGADGSNMGVPAHEFTINGEKIVAWYDDYIDKDLTEDFWHDVANGDETDADGNLERYIAELHTTDYRDLLEYFCGELGASTGRNVCALATDLAKYNNITMAELFRKYGGSNGNS